MDAGSCLTANTDALPARATFVKAAHARAARGERGRIERVIGVAASLAGPRRGGSRTGAGDAVQPHLPEATNTGE